VYLHRENKSAPWRIVAAEHAPAGAAAWRAEFRETQPSPAAGVPKSVRLSSHDGKGFDLRLSMSGVEINVPMEVEEVAPGGVACADSRPGNTAHGARIVARLVEAGAAMLAHLP